MCDASFIPIEQLRILTNRLSNLGAPDLTQQDYIDLRDAIASDKRNKHIEDKIDIAINAGRFHEIEDAETVKLDKDRFRMRLTAYAEAHSEYATGPAVERLNSITNDFFKSLPPPSQEKLISNRLLSIEKDLAGYYATWILDIGLKSGLFDAIYESKSAISIDELSFKLDLAPFYVAVWCKAAYGLELIEVAKIDNDHDGYILAPGIQEVLLDRTHPTSMRLDIEFSTALHQDFLLFPNHLRTGETWPLSKRPATLHKLYTQATMDDYPVITDVILPKLANEQLKCLHKKGTYGRILDVGTGAGFALIHYASVFKEAKIVGIDIDPSRVAEAYNTIQVGVKGFGLTRREIEVRCQDVNTLEEPKNDEKYDLIIINLVLYQIRFSEYRNVFKRIYKALQPDGIVVISEYNFPQFLKPERTYRFPGYQSFLSHLLHFALIGATMVPSGTLVEMLQEETSGFKFEVIDSKAIHHPLEERQVIVAKKQA